MSLPSKSGHLLKTVEIYLNSISTLEAKFVQISSNGDHHEGVLKLARPGNLRIDYNPPYPVVIVASKSYISYFDTKLGQVSNIPIDETPLAVLLAKQVSFSDNKILLKNFTNKNGVIQITISQKNYPQSGELTLFFSENPIEIRKWSIVDSRDITTNVALVESSFGIPIPKSTFNYELPYTDNAR